MSNHVYKILELVGSSTSGSDDAIRQALETASKTVPRHPLVRGGGDARPRGRRQGRPLPGHAQGGIQARRLITSAIAGRLSKP